MKQMTIYDIAEKAGVSHTTVSRIINNRDASIKISAKTRGKVLKVIRELNYQPKVFRGRKTGNFGILFSREVLHKPISDPFYSGVLEGVEEEMANQGYNLLLSGLDAETIAKSEMPQIVSRGYVDGVVVLGNIKEAYIRNLQSKEIPLLLLDNDVKDAEVLSVMSNGEKGAYIATKCLIEKGHRKIGYLRAKSDSPSFTKRFAGYKKALAENGIAFDKNLVVTSIAWGERGYDAMEKLMKKKISGLSAVACSNDLLAIFALKYLSENGISCPGQFSIIGFDDIPSCVHVSPSLSTVMVNKQEMGRQAVRMLKDLVNGEELEEKKVIIDAKLVLRESTGIK